MKHIKAIFEYEDDEIRSIIGDLETIGHEQLKGWCIGMVTDDGYFSIYVILAHNDGEMENIIRKDWEWASVGMPKKIGSAYKGEGNFYDNFLQALLSTLMRSENILYYQLIKDLTVRDSGGKKPGITHFPGHNPILASEELEKYFSNIKEKMSSPEFRGEFEEESSVFKRLL